MKNLISIGTLLLFCSFFALTSCSDDDSTEKVSATMQYRILVNADRSYEVGVKGGAIEQLYDYTNKEMDAVSKEFDTDSWTITEQAETKEAAIAECDKKATELFDAKFTAINAAATSVKQKFDAKKAELQSGIDAEKSTAHVSYTNYAGYLFKGDVDVLFPNIVVKHGTMYDMEAVGGVK